ncbi:hypothetical protein SLEP1_g57055 [Rubroshorea leprosula]|uniref:Uncharacterized protein n=1 Tax=Rubroshorea leprosula TaxID=152421 RepID=A0AAV5MP26_9ROSI|nr:hypothetical protein SLEP1_g57055 [Rubroshorea leprosula]
MENSVMERQDLFHSKKGIHELHEWLDHTVDKSKFVAYLEGKSISAWVPRTQAQVPQTQVLGSFEGTQGLGSGNQANPARLGSRNPSLGSMEPAPGFEEDRKDVRKILKCKDSDAGQRGRALEDLRASIFNKFRPSESAKTQQQRIWGS